MALGVPAQLDAALLVLRVDDADVPELFAGGGGLGAHCAELAVVVRELGEEVVGGDLRVRERLRDKGAHGDVGELDGHADFAGEDHGLAGNIHTGEIVAGVGLGISESLGLGHHGRERRAPVEFVEDVAQGAGENALDLDEFIACPEQVAQCGDDRQARTDVGLIEKVGLRLSLRLAHRLVVAHGARVGLLVRRNDTDALSEPRFVQSGRDFRRGAVDDGGVGSVAVLHVARKGLEIGRHGGLLQLGLPVVDVDRRLPEEHLLRRGEGSDSEINSKSVEQLFPLISDLIDEHASDDPRAHNPDRNRLRREVERRVRRAQRP
mmetsp:Transcript_4345/g.11246  ORF Transcript_4345/g.11246 Transcript_4345/m.11246 type:complete len:321 (+) Transcript_4345:238-1200(+)